MSFQFSSSRYRATPLIPLLLILISGSFIGCGSGGTGPTAPVSKNCIADTTSSAKVPILFTSDAALGQLTELAVGITSVTLTDACGKSIVAYTGAPQNTLNLVATIEFEHVSGVSEPLTVTSLPTATYTSATVTYVVVSSAFVYPNNLQFNAWTVQTNPITVPAELVNPISVANQSSAITLDLLLAQAFDLTTKNSLNSYAPTITPAFRLTGFTPAEAPTSDLNGFAYVRGLTSAIKSSTQFTMLNSVDIPLTINISNATTLQGFGNLAALPLNVPAAVDLALQSDGSLLANRIQIEDSSSMGNWTGPLVSTYPTGAYQYVSPQLWQQANDTLDTYNIFPFEFQFTGNTLFQRSGAAYDLTDLPFVPSFASFSDITLGQGLSINWLQQQIYGNQPQTEAHTATLVPRTFSGIITQAKQQNNFVTYTLQLNAQDTMVQLNGTNTITAYTNSGTRMEDGPLSAGMAVNMHGLAFFDQGVLKVVCDQTRLQSQP